LLRLTFLSFLPIILILNIGPHPQVYVQALYFSSLFCYANLDNKHKLLDFVHIFFYGYFFNLTDRLSIVHCEN